VTRPEPSIAQQRTSQFLDRFAQVSVDPSGPRIALEVFLLREPKGEHEIQAIEQAISVAANAEETATKDLPGGLGIVYCSAAPVLPEYVLDDHGYPAVPRLGTIKVVGLGDEVLRRIVVRIPFSDQRAAQFLRTEAAHFSHGDPNLIMIQLGGAAGTQRTWAAALGRRLHPGQHTRVSAVCMFASATTVGGVAVTTMDEIQLITNPHAAISLPGWLSSGLEALHGPET
jgi:hypothetical protein